ncbi:hypothetical protein JCM15519_27640 [Fundidesulfovibrio butyratiphilus]
MLAELVEYLLTPCSGQARRLGYMSQAVGLRARHRRLRAAWREHLERTRAFILEAAAQADPSGPALVLGSGALLDIPFRALCQRFPCVVLADMAHPWPARLAVWRAKNARLVPVDLTGCLPEVLAGRLPEPRALDLFADLRPAFTVSANLLSQLAFLPVARLQHSGRHQPEALKAFARGLRREHLEWLRRLPGTRCLVTDQESRLGESILPLVETAALGPPAARWTWNFAPRPEVSRHADEVRQVGAYLL